MAARDSNMAVALQEYLTLHKRRSSFSDVQGFYSSSEPSSPSRSYSVSSSASSTPESSGAPPPLHRRMSSIHETELALQRRESLQNIDEEMVATLYSLLKTKTAAMNKQFRAWVQTRLTEKERDIMEYNST